MIASVRPVACPVSPGWPKGNGAAMTTLLPRRVPGAAPVPVAVRADVVGEIAVVRLTGDLDLAAVEPVSAAVRRALAERPSGLVLDLADVPFCDTVGLRLLLSTAGKARAQGCSCAVAALRPAVADFLVRVCADRSLAAYRDVGDAIEGLMFSREWR
jgi:anti-sigma B factor antagonist